MIFAVGLLRAGISGDTILSTFMVAVSLAVAAIPGRTGGSGLLSYFLSSRYKHVKKKRHYPKLTAVETLGCTQIICSDKTGTLTQNKMTVVEHVSDDEKMLETAMSLCSDAELDKDSGEAVASLQSVRLLMTRPKTDCQRTELEKEYVRVGEAPFDSMRKMMSTVHRTPENCIIQFTKGAPDEVLKRCAYALSGGVKSAYDRRCERGYSEKQ